MTETDTVKTVLKRAFPEDAPGNLPKPMQDLLRRLQEQEKMHGQQGDESA